MTKSILISLTFLMGGLLFMQFTPDNPSPSTDEGIRWMTWEEVEAAQKKEQRKVIVDVYTHWCGWCKRMDKATFSDAKIIEYINENLYAVKFNAEQKEKISLKGKEYTYMKSGRRGVNTLAVELLGPRMGYPTIVYLDNNLDKILVSPGYKDPTMLMKEMTFVHTDVYKNVPWNEYNK